jgi:hypothetical protein
MSNDQTNSSFISTDLNTETEMGNICMSSSSTSVSEGDYKAASSNSNAASSSGPSHPGKQQTLPAGAHMLGSSEASSVGSKPLDPRAAAAAAAEKRAQASGASTLAERRRKEDLVGKVAAQYQRVGLEPPMGLPTCSIEQLNATYERLKSKPAGAFSQEKAM